jgi:hypothetical protein
MGALPLENIHSCHAEHKAAGPPTRTSFRSAGACPLPLVAGIVVKKQDFRHQQYIDLRGREGSVGCWITTKLDSWLTFRF